jgi:hypothetical protein
MNTLEFRPERRPFPRWLGPFSPARGIYSGFRFHGGRLGTWVEEGEYRTFSPILPSEGARAIAQMVRHEWGGGRVLFLPYGILVKPLQGDSEVGARAVLGRFTGSVVLEKPDGSVFDMGMTGLAEGSRWSGPRTTGLECTIDYQGALSCTWYHPSTLGRDEMTVRLAAPDKSLAAGFHRARPNDIAGRVRVTANSLVLSNHQTGTGEWVTSYIGRTNVAAWVNSVDWISGRNA